MKRTWQIVKEITGKSEHNSSKFPNSINANDEAMTKNINFAKESINTILILDQI